MVVPRFFFWQGKLLWVSCITMLSKIAGFVNGILCKYFIFTRDAEDVVPYYIVPNKTLYFKVRIQKAPSGRELRRKAVRESACNCNENSDLSVGKSEMIRKQVGIQILICTPGSFRQPCGCHLPPEEGSLKCQVLKGTA